jgi:ectoine hydroxylase-related dioxygenase (phytanoyl-CoA dioxygenase family)
MIELSTTDRQNFNEDGFVIVERLVEPGLIPGLHKAFDDLFRGDFETGVQPDEVNWQEATGDPTLSRQICNGWKVNRSIARVALGQPVGKAIAELSGWPGVRIMQDNVIWKPAATKSLGFHQDSAYLDWFTPSDLLTCWIALDDTHADGGTIKFVRGSHKWRLSPPDGEFHAPPDYRKPMLEAAAREGVEPEIVHVEVKAGGGSFHHAGPGMAPAPTRARTHTALWFCTRCAPMSNTDRRISPRASDQFTAATSASPTISSTKTISPYCGTKMAIARRKLQSSWSRKSND